MSGSKHIPRRPVVLAGLLSAAVTFSCGVGWSRTAPRQGEEGRAGGQRTPVVFVAGVTGVALRDLDTGKLVWGAGGNLISPHDRGHATAKPLVEASSGPALAPAGAILTLRFWGLMGIDVYQPLVDLFESNGYGFGDLDSPRPEDDFFLFSYDWRQDNVASAQRLARQLENLKQARRQDRLSVVLICQSNGAHVCRYFGKYGALSMEEAEAGLERSPPDLEVAEMVLVGASNGGSITILREMTAGRKYVPAIGRFWSPETLFTYRSLFQDLPVYSQDLFVDEQGAPMSLDLFDAQTWQQYEWSIYGPATQRQLGKKRLPPWLGNREDRALYLRENLRRAQRFHRLLEKDTGHLGGARYYLVTNTHLETPARAVLLRRDDHWRTLFAGDKRLRKRPDLQTLISVPGDGHATAMSQKWLSPEERAHVAREPLDVDAGHRMVMLHPAVLAYLLEILADNGELSR